ncbi:hypothetical protein [Bifidobacterium crudilactis]|uniref:hypothetical protein n=1 Tax=Bifidobacterium crudilactis TaxID=327277 RepID=UPI00068D10DF|nr:hypothetical protein [Bifidobacterium crudilactis]
MVQQGEEQVDYSRLPVGEEALSRLVRAIANTGDTAERHSLEIKGSRFDVTSKKDKSKIAKFILGAANRDPEIAKRHFQGYALMFIGVDDHEIGGVDRIEKMELDKVIRQFLGASGPKWDVQRLPADHEGKEVLIVLVDPPEQGQPAFPCRADGEGLKNGAIYFRADGSTRDALADEIDMLTRRGRLQTTPIKLHVSVRGSAYRSAIDRAKTLDAYIAATEKTLLEALPAKSSQSAYNVFRGGGVLMPWLSEPRTEEEYRKAIEAWKKECSRKWADALDNVNGWMCSPYVFAVENTTKANLKAVRLRICMDGSMTSVEHRVDPGETFGSDVNAIGLPQAPRIWGQRSWMQDSGVIGDVSSYLSSAISVNPVISTKHVNGQFVIEVDAGDIRPLDTFASTDCQEVLLAPAQFEGEVIHCTWKATVQDVDEVFEGELTIPVEPVRDITQIARYLLDLDPIPDDCE